LSKRLGPRRGFERSRVPVPDLLHRHLVAIAENDRLHPFLLGVAAGVIGLIATVTVTILETSVVDVWTALIALCAFAALQRWCT
jgi:hypothetical protein